MRIRLKQANRKKGRLHRLTALFLIIMLMIFAAGCGKQAAPDPGQQTDIQTTVVSAENEISDPSGQDTEAEEPEDLSEDVPDENGSYTSKEDVALYLHTYGKLPPNFITKKEAQKLGWQGGSLEKYAPGKCIGGDRFGNYEGILPDEGSYHECDIDTLGASGRGAKRIVYSDDGQIYYTEDHYETFEQLY